MYFLSMMSSKTTGAATTDSWTYVHKNNNGYVRDMYSLDYYTWRAIYIVHVHNQFKNSLIFFIQSFVLQERENNYWGLLQRKI